MKRKVASAEGGKRQQQIPVCRQAGLTPIRERRGWVRDDSVWDTVRGGSLRETQGNRATI